MDRHRVESRLIRSVGYDLPASVLEVELVEGGRVYRYFDVPYSAFGEFHEAESKGRYFNDFVRDLYAFEEVAPDTPPPIGPGDWSTPFAAALPYAAFLDRHASPAHGTRWDAMHRRIELTSDQMALLGGFIRRMPVLVLAGTWCGDCVNQCPIFDHFARASTALDVRFLDRDAISEVAEALAINGGHRVPVALFLSEDFREVARHGERTLSAYRRLAAAQLGPACPTGLVPPDDEATRVVVGEWLDQFERAQLILRLSPRFREKYGD